eukprot:g6548.t1
MQQLNMSALFGAAREIAANSGNSGWSDRPVPPLAGSPGYSATVELTQENLAEYTRMASFVTALLFNSIVAACVLIAFSCSRPRFPWFYYPLQYKEKSEQTETGPTRPQLSTSVCLSGAMSISMPAGLLGYLRWIPHSFTTSEQEVHRWAGEDGVVYVRFHRFSLKLFGGMTLLACAVLMPVYAYAGPSVALDQLCLTNVPNQSHLLWLPTVALWHFSFWAFYLLSKECQRFVELRHKYMLTHLQSPAERSLFVEGLAGTMLNEDTHAAFWRRIYGQCVDQTVLVRDAEALRTLVETREKALSKLKLAEALAALPGASRPKVLNVRKFASQLPGKNSQTTRSKKGQQQDSVMVDSIDYHTQWIQELSKEINTLVEADRPGDTRQTGLKAKCAGFVTFKSVKDQTIALQIPPTIESTVVWHIRKAPQPQDVLWGNLGISSLMRWLRTLFISSSVFFLIFFYIIPVSFISVLTSLSSLTKAIPFLEPLLNASPAIRGILEGVLPTLVLNVFLSVLPTILTFLAIKKGDICRSEVLMDLFRYYHLFNLFNVFLVFTLSGSILQDIEGVVKNPTSIPKLLGSALPAQGFFFLNYMMLQALSVWPMKLLNPVALVLEKVARKRIKVSEELEAMQEAKDKDPWPSALNYGTEYSVDLLMCTISFSYAVISPLILCFAVLYNVTCLIGGSYLITHVEKPKFQAGGRFFVLVFDRLISAMVVAQLTLAGFLGVKESPIPSALSLVLVGATLLFWSRMHKIYLSPAELLTMDVLTTTASADLAGQLSEEKVDSSQNEVEIVENLEHYMDPAVRAVKDPVQQQAMRAILQDADTVVEVPRSDMEASPFRSADNMAATTARLLPAANPSNEAASTFQANSRFTHADILNQTPSFQQIADIDNEVSSFQNNIQAPYGSLDESEIHASRKNQNNGAIEASSPYSSLDESESRSNRKEESGASRKQLQASKPTTRQRGGPRSSANSLVEGQASMQDPQADVPAEASASDSDDQDDTSS